MKAALLAGLFLALVAGVCLWREYAAQRRLDSMAQKLRESR